MTEYAERSVAENVAACARIVEALTEMLPFFPDYVFEKDEFIDAARDMWTHLNGKIATHTGHRLMRLRNAEAALERGDSVARDVMDDLLHHRRKMARSEAGR